MRHILGKKRCVKTVCEKIKKSHRGACADLPAVENKIKKALELRSGEPETFGRQNGSALISIVCIKFHF